MKFFKFLALAIILNLLLLTFQNSQSNAMSKRKLMQMKKLGALAMLMKMQNKKKFMMAVPIPIPIPLGLLKGLKKDKDKDFFCEHNNQIKSFPKPNFQSWAIPEMIQRPAFRYAFKPEPIIAIPANPITIPMAMQPNHVIIPNEEALEIQAQPFVQIEQSIEPDQRLIAKTNERVKLENVQY